MVNVSASLCSGVLTCNFSTTIYQSDRYKYKEVSLLVVKIIYLEMVMSKTIRMFALFFNEKLDLP